MSDAPRPTNFEPRSTTYTPVPIGFEIRRRERPTGASDKFPPESEPPSIYPSPLWGSIFVGLGSVRQKSPPPPKYVTPILYSWGVFYVRDSIYGDKNGPTYDYDLSRTGEEAPHGRKIILRSYEWLQTAANHVVQISSNRN